MLRSQMAVVTAANPSYGLTPPRPYPVSKTARTSRSPSGRGMEIDVEYGTDEEAMEQMGSDWWVDGAQVERCRPTHCRGLKADPLVNVAADQLRWVCCPSALLLPRSSVDLTLRVL